MAGPWPRARRGPGRRRGVPDVRVLEGTIRPAAELRQARFRGGSDSTVSVCLTVASRASEPYAARGSSRACPIHCRCAAAGRGGERTGSDSASARYPRLASAGDSNSVGGMVGIARAGGKAARETRIRGAGGGPRNAIGRCLRHARRLRRWVRALFELFGRGDLLGCTESSDQTAVSGTRGLDYPG